MNESFWKGFLLILQNEKVSVDFKRVQINSALEVNPVYEPSFKITMPDSEIEAITHSVAFQGDMRNLSIGFARKVIPEPKGIGIITPDHRGARKFPGQYLLHVGTETIPAKDEKPETTVAVLAIKERAAVDSNKFTTKGFRTNGTEFSAKD